MIKDMFILFTVLLMTFILSLFINIKLLDLGVPSFFTVIISFLIGLLFPGLVIRWIKK